MLDPSVQFHTTEQLTWGTMEVLHYDDPFADQRKLAAKKSSDIQVHTSLQNLLMFELTRFNFELLFFCFYFFCFLLYGEFISYRMFIV